MSEEQHLIYFSSVYATHDKVTGSFTTNLPFTLHLEGKWKCAVLDFSIKPDISDSNSPQYIYILADFCKTSIIHQIEQSPILRKVALSDAAQLYEFANPIYISLKQNSLTDFDLFFTNSLLNPIKFHKSNRIECTLHFIKDD